MGNAERHQHEHRRVRLEDSARRIPGARREGDEGHGHRELRRPGGDGRRPRVHRGDELRPQVPGVRQGNGSAPVGDDAAIFRQRDAGDLRGRRASIRRDCRRRRKRRTRCPVGRRLRGICVFRVKRASCSRSDSCRRNILDRRVVFDRRGGHHGQQSKETSGRGSDGIHAPEMDQERRGSRRRSRRIDVPVDSTAWPRPCQPATGRIRHCRGVRHEDRRRDDRRQGSRVHPQRHQYLQRHSVCPQHRRHAEIHAAREARSMERACGARSRSVRRARSPSTARLKAAAAVGTTTKKRSCSTGTTGGRRRIACGSTCGRLESTTTGAGPVLVWIHGGGYSSGSSNELRMYDGESLSRRGDAVVVSLNHRLGVLGYLNLAEYGEKWARASNAGMLDIVAALEWVRDNIANFGGDPHSVLIFGQSGGGGKVGTLMGMPTAKGLVPAGRDTERLRCPQASAGSIAGAGGGRAERARARSVERQQAAGAAVRAHRRGRTGRATEAQSDACGARHRWRRELGSGGRRQAPARTSVGSQRARRSPPTCRCSLARC